MPLFFDDLTWTPPAHWTRIKTLDMHTGGEPLRVITSGLPTIEGRTVLEKRRYFREHYDHLRTGLMWPEGEVDRSATGSGVSARAALHHAAGELDAQQQITIESILGSTMSVRVVEQVKFGAYDAVIPEVGGNACYSGRHEFWFDPADPLGQGFIFR